MQIIGKIFFLFLFKFLTWFCVCQTLKIKRKLTRNIAYDILALPSNVCKQYNAIYQSRTCERFQARVKGQCQCICAAGTTLGVFNGRLACTDDIYVQISSGCGESVLPTLEILPSSNLDVNCTRSHSPKVLSTWYLSCNGTWTRYTGDNVYTFRKRDKGFYLSRVSRQPRLRNLDGRVIRVNFSCNVRGTSSKEYCVLFKMSGALKCNIQDVPLPPIIPMTTPARGTRQAKKLLTTSPSTVAESTTMVSETTTPTSPLQISTKVHLSSSATFPVVAPTSSESPFTNQLSIVSSMLQPSLTIPTRMVLSTSTSSSPPTPKPSSSLSSSRPPTPSSSPSLSSSSSSPPSLTPSPSVFSPHTTSSTDQPVENSRDKNTRSSDVDEVSIIASVVASVFVVCLVIVIIVCYKRKRTPVIHGGIRRDSTSRLESNLQVPHDDQGYALPSTRHNPNEAEDIYIEAGSIIPQEHNGSYDNYYCELTPRVGHIYHALESAYSNRDCVQSPNQANTSASLRHIEPPNHVLGGPLCDGACTEGVNQACTSESIRHKEPFYQVLEGPCSEGVRGEGENKADSHIEPTFQNLPGPNTDGNFPDGINEVPKSDGAYLEGENEVDTIESLPHDEPLYQEVPNSVRNSAEGETQVDKSMPFHFHYEEPKYEAPEGREGLDAVGEIQACMNEELASPNTDESLGDEPAYYILEDPDGLSNSQQRDNADHDANKPRTKGIYKSLQGPTPHLYQDLQR